MDKNSTGNNSPPLAENPYVQELFAIMQENGKDTKGLAALIGHVSEMEGFVKRAEDKIADMKSQLSEMKEVQNHPVKTSLQNTIKSLETKVATVKIQLAKLKQNIIEGCKNAVTAFKEKGITALNSLAGFFHIKDGLSDWKKDIDFAIQADYKAISKIESFSSEYHSAGRALKNMVRIAVGKVPLDKKKEAGKLAKTIAAPYMAQKFALSRLKKSINKAISVIDKMEQTESVKQAERAAIKKKPHLMKRIEANKERSERSKLELPTPERVKAKGVEV